MAKPSKAVATQGGFSTNDAVTKAKTGAGVAQPDKVPAKQMSDDQAFGAVIADKLVAHLDGGDRGMFAEMHELATKGGRDAKITALGSVQAILKDRVAQAKLDYQGSDKRLTDLVTKKINSIRSSFSRITVVIEAMLSTVNGYDFGDCTTYAEMIAVARQYSNSKGKNAGTEPLNATGVDEWLNKGLRRIVDVDNYDVKKDSSIAQVARWEKVVVAVLKRHVELCAKITGMKPIADLIGKPTPAVRSHLRRAA